ncbi:hypothetical protein HLH26_02755 [Gluconacetobacter sp. 1b LMG 1731]|uniref:Uncharacterized protein n=1 Tax=Gluconacetobacter dulcium TaxID=2729096 RepID=A0A7W4NTR0_9PROT|nr:hypothetical protein [Gluconacetobacter dulcium]MBB2163468.1 hypothetical protein [Gluconacetobacter dulcium]MBB2192415.1 hypothetical protein [Gluconacetobacter dulcium]
MKARRGTGGACLTSLSGLALLVGRWSLVAGDGVGFIISHMKLSFSLVYKSKDFLEAMLHTRFKTIRNETLSKNAREFECDKKFTK